MSGRPSMEESYEEAWTTANKEYLQLIRDPQRDSCYLREYGLKPLVRQLVGDCRNSRVLDIGCGDCWLLDSVQPAEGYACDIHPPPSINPKWKFQIEDICRLSYPDEFFDVVVTSMVLHYVAELDLGIRQIYRVAKPEGRAVVAIMHPYFYRTGQIVQDGDFVISEDLSKQKRVDVKVAGVLALPYHYRPFPDYINACIAAGFRVRQLLDWFIDMDDYAVKAGNGMRSGTARSGKVPMYSFILCGK